MPTFTPPPTNPEAPAGEGRLFVRYGLNRGVTVVQRLDGTFYSTRFPSAQELDDAKRHWLGGYTYDIDSTTAAQLVAAGFTVTQDTYRAGYEDGY